MSIESTPLLDTGIDKYGSPVAEAHKHKKILMGNHWSGIFGCPVCRPNYFSGMKMEHCSRSIILNMCQSWATVENCPDLKTIWGLPLITYAPRGGGGVNTNAYKCVQGGRGGLSLIKVRILYACYIMLHYLNHLRLDYVVWGWFGKSVIALSFVRGFKRAIYQIKGYYSSFNQCKHLYD